MTIGQKLHQCRTEAGLSQEEVAGKLLVSRQTISLWETDQTLPTIDNLIRLKELFGISVDELLTGEERKADEQPSAEIIESFTYAPSKDDLKQVSRRVKRNDLLRYLLLLPMLFMWVVLIYVDAPDVLTAFIFGIWFVALAVCVSRSIRLRKQLRRSAANAASTAYKYELTDNGLYIGAETNGVERNRYCLEQGEMKCSELDEVFELDTKHGIFAVGREALCAAPRILSFIKSPSPSEKALSKKSKKAVKTASILLLVNACLSFPLTALCIGLSEANYIPPIVLWLIPLAPLACLLFGIIFLKRGYAVKRNIIIGAIFFTITLIFCLLFTAHFKTKRGAEDIMADLSQKYSFAFPESVEAVGMDDIKADDLCRIAAGRVCMASLGLDGSGKKAYYSGDDRWIQGLPEELAPYVPEQFRTAPDSDAHYILIDRDSGLVNTPPDGAGHRMVLFYVPEYGYTIYAAEYTLEN